VVTAYGSWFSPNLELSASQLSQEFDSGLGAGVESLKLLLGVKSGGQTNWHVVIRDAQYRVLAVLGAKDFEGSASRRRWTGRLPTNRVIADFRAPSTSDAIIEFPAGIALPKESSDTRLFSIQGHTPAWKPLYESDSSVARRAGDPVGMLIAAAVLADGQKHSWCCSGVLLSSNILLTNWHCGGTSGMHDDAYWNSDVCGNTIVDLGWDDGRVSRQYSCDQVVAKNKALDFALLRLKPVIGMGGVAGEPIKARWSESNATIPSTIFVIHHAQCKPKLLSDRCSANEIQGIASQTIFTHACDTEPGASGAPIFDAGGRLVGLHQAGFARDAQCKPTDNINKGIKFNEILRLLRSENAAVAAELVGE
jgi:hypothetical protein